MMTNPLANDRRCEQYDSLYVHVPFCTQKCGYCAFYSVTDAGLIDSYLERLADEVARKCGLCGPLRSLYIGGGTPNSLSAQNLARLLGLLRDSFTLADDCEFSTEMNPVSYTDEKLDVALEHGVSRFSVGVQSFNPVTRATMGRCGDVAACRQVLRKLNDRDIGNFGCDMIFAVPGQSTADWEADLRELINYRPKHVSAYSLTIEPDTPIGRAGLSEADEDAFVEHWELSDAVLGEAGIKRYEISNFATPGHQCRHNDEIWHGHPFMAVGPAAHWFDGETRWANPNSISRWLDGEEPVADRLSARDRAVEILIVGLRTLRGWDQDEFQATTGFDALVLREEAIASLSEHGLLHVAGTQLRPTGQGLILGDVVAEYLL